MISESTINKMLKLAEEHNVRSDPSHDLTHLKRVLANAVLIASREGADLDLVVPAAIFHDLITYRKDDKRSKNAQAESARLAGRILKRMGFKKQKIKSIEYAIEVCSFSKNIKPKTLEAKVLQDADLLEATGAISIMRTFASSGVMQRAFYNERDPFCKNRKPNSLNYSVDLFYDRLLIARGRMHTKTAKNLALKRTKFLIEFIKQLKRELYFV